MTRLSLKTKISLVVSSLLLLTLAATTVLTLHYFEGELRRTVATDLQSLTSALGAEIDGKMGAARDVVALLAERLGPRLLADPAAAGQLLSEQMGIAETFDNGLYVFDAAGRILGGTGIEEHMWGLDFSTREYFRTSRRLGRPYISQPFASIQRHGHPIVMVTAPIFGADGTAAGLLVGSIDLLQDNILGRMMDIRVGKGGYLNLFSADGTIMHHPDHALILSRTLAPEQKDLFFGPEPTQEGTGETRNLRGVPMLTSFRRLQTGNWVLAADFPLAEAHAPIEKARFYFILGVAGIVAIALLCVWKAMNALTRPLQALTAYVRNQSQEDAVAAEVPVLSRDEIGSLALAFGGLMEKVRRSRVACLQQKNFVESLIQHAAAPIFVIDREHRVIAWNRACEELTGVKADEVKGTDGHWQAFYDQPCPCLADFVIDGRSDGLADRYESIGPSTLIDNGLQAEGWRTTGAGRRRYLIFSAAPILGDNGDIVAVIQTLEDITTRKMTEKRFQTLALHDPLTGLANRTQFFERLELAIAAASLDREKLALLYIDLDDFKRINDSAGHAAGDWVLTEVARVLKQSVRDKDLVARMGGDEFTILLPRVVDRTEAHGVADRILASLTAPFVFDGCSLSVGASIGVSVFPEDGLDADTLLRRGDASMYRKKSSMKEDVPARVAGSGARGEGKLICLNLLP